MRAALALVLLAACADLHELPADACGNGVIDPGEDCDTVTDPQLGAGLACESCRYVRGEHSACPFGWGAGADHVCHYGDGSFTEIGAIALIGDVQSGDFDGDHLVDVVVSSNNGLSILFGDGDGGFGSAYVFDDREVGPVTVDDVDSDGRSDLLFDVGDGLAVLRGAPGRTFIPVQFPVANLVAPSMIGFGDIVAARPTARSLHRLVHTGVDGVTGDFAIGVEDWLPGAAAPVELAGQPGGSLLSLPVIARGNLDDGPGADGDEIVLAFSDSPVVHVVSIVADPDDSNPRIVARSQLALPGNATQPPVLGDVDGDGRLDVIAACNVAGTDEVVIALGLGNAAFAAPVVAPEFGARYPVAAADLDGDGRADFALCSTDVFATTADLAVHRGGQLDVIGETTSNTGCPDAAVGDFNRDGRLDVARRTNAGVDLFLASSQGGVTHVTRPTGADPEALRAGDFDGDGVDDLVFYTGNGSLHAIYGAVDGALPQAVAVGEVDSVLDLEPGRFSTAGTGVAILSGLDVYFLAGRPERTLLSTTATFSGGPRTAGSFFGPGEHDLVFASDPSTMFTTQFAELTVPPQLAIKFAGADPTDFGSGAWLTAPSSDLEDHADAILSISNDELAYIVGTMTPNPSTLHFRTVPYATDGAIPEGAFAADLDGDGEVELVLPRTDVVDVVHAAARDASPTIDELASFGGSVVITACPIHAGPLGGAIVVATNDHLLLYQRGPDGFPDVPLAIPISGFPKSVRAGDFNGDGVDDLFYTDLDGAHVLVGHAAPPLGG